MQELNSRRRALFDRQVPPISLSPFLSLFFQPSKLLTQTKQKVPLRLGFVPFAVSTHIALTMANRVRLFLRLLILNPATRLCQLLGVVLERPARILLEWACFLPLLSLWLWRGPFEGIKQINENNIYLKKKQNKGAGKGNERDVY